MIEKMLTSLDNLRQWLENRLPFLIAKKRGGIFHLLLTLLLMMLALLVRLGIAPVSGGLQYVTFFPAVTLAAVIGGYRPGLFATFIGVVLATFIFTPPYQTFSLEVIQNAFWPNIVFIIDGIIVSFSIESMHRYRLKYQQELIEVKQQEAQLRIAAVTFESDAAVVITDTAARIVRVNKAFENITGYSQEEVIGKNPRILKSGHHEAEFYQAMWNTLLATGKWKGELWERHKSGATYPKEMSITAIHDDKGKKTHYVSIFNNISDRRQAESEIHNLAFYDPLTQLPNRRLFMDRLGVALSLSSRSEKIGALLFLDMDNFKTLNDTLGHNYGDLLLIEVAGRLKSCIRECDSVARIGGDEFTVLIENTATEESTALVYVAQIAEKIRDTLAAPYKLKEHTHRSTPSIGVCMFSGSKIAAGDLIKRADMAMYQAKKSGRNCVRFFDMQLQHSVEEHAFLESELRTAITSNQLQLYYQIQVNHAHTPLGAEALVRWNHPKRGVVSPAQFIPVAEESSLILELGHWVLDTACQQLAIWSRSEHTSKLVLAVNVSAKQFKQPDFVESIKGLIDKYRIVPSLLKLELTESVIMNNLDEVVAKMQALREEVGVRLSLDDFGTGYSSLSYLKRMPLDQVKIDQSFVRDMEPDSSDTFLVKTIIDMAKNFNLNVIAEGVESELQLGLLGDNGCKAYQGYLFSRPVPLEQFEALLNVTAPSLVSPPEMLDWNI